MHLTLKAAIMHELVLCNILYVALEAGFHDTMIESSSDLIETLPSIVFFPITLFSAFVSTSDLISGNHP